MLFKMHILKLSVHRKLCYSHYHRIIRILVRPLHPPSSHRRLQGPEHGPEEAQEVMVAAVVEVEEEAALVEVVAMVLGQSRTDNLLSLGLRVWWRLRRTRMRN